MTDDRVAVVTGGNKGIGYAIVRGLCERFQGRVYLTSRDETRGHAAVANLNLLGLRPWYHQLDVTDPSSIDNFREFLERTHGGLDVLVNNAAINYQKDSKEPFGEQAEHTIRVNFSGVVSVCEALFPLLRPRARVVHLCSTAGHVSRICGYEPHAATLRAWLTSPDLKLPELNRLMREFVTAARSGRHRQQGWPGSAYAVSKVGVAALTRIQQRQLDQDDRDVTVNCVHPGLVRTDLSRHKGTASPEHGARLPLCLALMGPDVEAPRGQFVWNDGSLLDWESGRTPGTFHDPRG